MRIGLLSAGFVVSLLLLISGCGQDKTQSPEPASKGPAVTKPASMTEPETVEIKTTELELEETEESAPKPPPTLKE